MHNTEYCVIPQGNGFKIGVKLMPQYSSPLTGAMRNKALAIALLDTLNAAHYRANICNPETLSILTHHTAVSFEEPVNTKEQRIIATFYLEKPDPDEIRNVWDQAQRFLTDTMNQAVAAFDVVLAVASINPYKARLLDVIRGRA